MRDCGGGGWRRVDHVSNCEAYTSQSIFPIFFLVRIRSVFNAIKGFFNNLKFLITMCTVVACGLFVDFSIAAQLLGEREDRGGEDGGDRTAAGHHRGPQRGAPCCEGCAILSNGPGARPPRTVRKVNLPPNPPGRSLGVFFFGRDVKHVGHFNTFSHPIHFPPPGRVIYGSYSEVDQAAHLAKVLQIHKTYRFPGRTLCATDD